MGIWQNPDGSYTIDRSGALNVPNITLTAAQYNALFRMPAPPSPPIEIQFNQPQTPNMGPSSSGVSPTQPIIVNFNQNPAPLGPVTQSGVSGSTGDPSVDSKRAVVGQVPNSSCSFKNPA